MSLAFPKEIKALSISKEFEFLAFSSGEEDVDGVGLVLVDRDLLHLAALLFARILNDLLLSVDLISGQLVRQHVLDRGHSILRGCLK